MSKHDKVNIHLHHANDSLNMESEGNTGGIFQFIIQSLQVLS